MAENADESSFVEMSAQDLWTGQEYATARSE